MYIYTAVFKCWAKKRNESDIKCYVIIKVRNCKVFTLNLALSHVDLGNGF